MCKMKYHTYLFDMDGTVLDTAADLAGAVNHTLQKYGFPPRTETEVVAATGNGATVLVEKSLPAGRSTPIFDEILADYKAYYQAHTVVRTGPYPGIPELLAELQARGARVAIVSNKPHGAAVELGSRFFPGIPVFGESPERPRKPAPDMVFHALEELGADAEGAVYIGDSEVDAATAANAGLPLIAVAWGFRTEQQLRQAGAQTIAHVPADIAEISR